jgi:hypothetical protein
MESLTENKDDGYGCKNERNYFPLNFKGPFITVNIYSFSMTETDGGHAIKNQKMFP